MPLVSTQRFCFASTWRRERTAFWAKPHPPLCWSPVMHVAGHSSHSFLSLWLSPTDLPSQRSPRSSPLPHCLPADGVTKIVSIFSEVFCHPTRTPRTFQDGQSRRYFPFFSVLVFRGRELLLSVWFIIQSSRQIILHLSADCLALKEGSKKSEERGTYFHVCASQFCQSTCLSDPKSWNLG